VCSVSCYVVIFELLFSATTHLASFFACTSIVYRDLKPDNIGFDVRDDVKIFDLGLAREFNPSQKDAEGTYNFTGDTGSPRYMATEVALGRPYNERVDVYSFSILLWQMLQMETPFETYTMKMFHNKVIKGGVRPRPDPKWPKDIVDTMRLGWGEPATRPSMDDVCELLRAEINRNTDEEIDEIMDASRKSEMSLHRL
jgi:serine/threonine protein kinase